MRLSSCTRRSRVTEEVLRDGCEAGSFSPRQGAKALLMDGTAVESAFALLLTKVTKPPYPAKVS